MTVRILFFTRELVLTSSQLLYFFVYVNLSMNSFYLFLPVRYQAFCLEVISHLKSHFKEQTLSGFKHSCFVPKDFAKIQSFSLHPNFLRIIFSKIHKKLAFTHFTHYIYVQRQTNVFYILLWGKKIGLQKCVIFIRQLSSNNRASE